MRLPRLLAAVSLTALGLASLTASGRVISYAPVTDKLATPALQERTNRRFVLLESESFSSFWGGGDTMPPIDQSSSWLTRGRLVVHDASGEEEPRVVLPASGEEASFSVVAAREANDGSLQILAVTDANPSGGPPANSRFSVLLSLDGGRSWKNLPLPPKTSVPAASRSPWNWPEDFGGPFCRGRNPLIRVGNDDTPFVLQLGGGASGSSMVLASVSRDASLGLLAELPGEGASLIGRSPEGDSLLLAGRVRAPGGPASPLPPPGIYLVRSSRPPVLLVELRQIPSVLEGWTVHSEAGSEEVLVEVDWKGATPVSPFKSPRALYRVSSKAVTEILAAPPGLKDVTALSRALFAIPAAASDPGAWIIQRGPGSPTSLAFYSATTGQLVEKWKDVTAPEVEALHRGAGNDRLLIQVHRPRPQMDQRIFQDPALAVWKEGEGAPRFYDELFLNEQRSKGFVHVNVDTIADGAPFVFDSGLPESVRADAPGGGSGGSAGGGADVSQEWGVVKASLRQRLVIPAVARAAGVNGAFWKSDVILRNPGNAALTVTLRFVPESGAPLEVPVELLGYEIRQIPDVVSSIFQLQNGSGALFITPEGRRSVEATSRTYTSAGTGSFGMSLGATDVHAAASARFGLTFSAAFQGPDFRTNLGAVNVSSRLSEVWVEAAGDSGPMGRTNFTFTVPAGGFSQVNRVNDSLGLPAWRQGAIGFTPLAGEAVPFLVTIDNSTNDPTCFPPDLSARVVRMIPALVHADGANGARFRSDLFLYNASSELRSVTLAAKRWDSNENERIVTLTLLPKESKTVRDALRVIFGLNGTARLRFQSSGSLSDPGIRVTSRTYTITDGEGTYGLVVPPLNAFQTAGPGESLEILAITGGKEFRTNLSLVEASISSTGANARARIELVDQTGRTIDFFQVNVPVAGGIQIDDIFRARGLGDGPEAALIRISPLSGLIGAYATTIDHETNDPSYFAAGLAAQE